jgi:ABC-type dipeptide/oligopeptide/nickel transport system permease subunit
LLASNAFLSAGAASPDEFYDLYTMDLEPEGQWTRAWRRFRRHRLAMASLVIITIVFAAGFLASRLAPYGYEEVNIKALSASPSWAHPFGTDQVGRDYFSRTLHGLRTEAEIALLIGFFGTLIGVLVGASAGYLGGLTDRVVMRLVDLLLTVPPLVVVLVAASFFKTNTLSEVSLLFAAVLWMPVARVVRSATLVVREQEYVQAARAMGAGDLRIIRRHVLPNVVGAAAVAGSVLTATAVILETTLSYLGLGSVVNFYGGRTDTKLPSVGDVLAAASNEGLFHWWGIVFPGIAIILIVAPIYFIGDGIRDALDPTQRRYVSDREVARRRRGPSRVTRLVRAIPRPNVSVRIRTPKPVVAVSDALARRRARHTRPRLLVEAAVVLALTAGAGALVYVWQMNPVSSTWRLAATEVQNVSRADGAQTQVSVAADPARRGTLFAVSNDTSLRTVRVYTSSDDGRTWTSTAGPALGLDACARGEPTAAVDAQGRQYVAFTVSGTCQQDDQTPYIVAAVRADAGAPWTIRRLGPHRVRDFWDDHPSIVAGPGGRIYVSWSRLLRWTYEGIVVSSSADGGRTWSQPRLVDRRLSYPRLAMTTVAPDGTLYVAGIDARFGVWLARSADAGKTFRLARVARLPGNRAADCATASNHPTPYQGIRCLGPNPTVAASRDRVFVTYGVGWPGEPQSVHIGVFDAAFHPLWRGPVAPPAPKADRFWPASSFDLATSRLWACFYDTSGDSARTHAWYACASSRDGRRWTTPVRAARDSASAEVLWEDARVYAFGDVIGYGGSTGVAAAGGQVHPLWIDTGDLGGNKQEVFGATLP